LGLYQSVDTDILTTGMETQQDSNILPAPALQSRGVGYDSGTTNPAAPVQAPGSASVHQPSAANPPVHQPAQDNQAQPQVQMSAAPLTADDNDLIEKEWVVRAKEIVSSTRQDPYQQNRSIMRLRADYLKKRYNKDVDIGKA
jgi:hypothetical protein